MAARPSLTASSSEGWFGIGIDTALLDDRMITRHGSLCLVGASGRRAGSARSIGWLAGAGPWNLGWLPTCGL